MNEDRPQPDTVFYRYPPRSLLGDYLRTAGGLALGLTVLASSGGSTWIVGIFGSLVLIFCIFGLRTLRQQFTRVALNGQGLFIKVLATKALLWEDLSALKLRYFGTRRERRRNDGGFLQLTLTGSGGKMTFESRIEGFADIAWHAAKAARRNGVALDPTTAGNLLGLGIHADEDTPRPAIVPGEGA
jgi:hypothetical protein